MIYVPGQNNHCPIMHIFIFIIIVHWMQLTYLFITNGFYTFPLQRIENYLPSATASFLYATDSDGKNECLVEGWDIVEHPTFPPPPSQSEDVEHWTRAMFIDAKGK